MLVLSYVMITLMDLFNFVSPSVYMKPCEVKGTAFFYLTNKLLIFHRKVCWLSGISALRYIFQQLLGLNNYDN